MPPRKQKNIATIQPDDILILPDPGQGVDRDIPEFATREIRLPEHKNESLKAILSAYGLPKSGNRQTLISRLRDFAGDRERWTTTVIWCILTMYPKVYFILQKDVSEEISQRIVSLFGPKETPQVFKPKKSGTETRPATLLSPQKCAENDAWTSLVFERRRQQRGGATDEFSKTADSGTHGNVQSNDDAGSGELPGNKLTTTSIRIERLNRQVVNLDDHLAHEFGAVHTHLASLHGLVVSLATQHGISPSLPTPALPHSTSIAQSEAAFSGLSISAIPTHLQLSHTSRQLAISLPEISAINPGASIILSPQSSATVSEGPIFQDDSEIQAENKLTFDLDGTTLTFDKTTVPNPPKVSFANDVTRLFREWHHSTLLVINGRGIPIKHWERFYKKRAGIKQFAWDRVRVQWGQWKFLVEARERFPSEEAFWAKYTDENGQQYGFQKLLDHLQGDRKDGSTHDAEAALWFFGNDLSSSRALGYFTYKKSGKMLICSKPQAIAEKWRKLLREQSEVAADWALVREDFEAQQSPSSRNPEAMPLPHTAD
ncbi:hypothetical protein C8Q80DRAFT_1118221 [Daedaleopsis nitida]|nr:hypothetical protein C8Q80DRAFT_1118221 [Daedaleopsis nitida]